MLMIVYQWLACVHFLVRIKFETWEGNPRSATDA